MLGHLLLCHNTQTQLLLNFLPKSARTVTATVIVDRVSTVLVGRLDKLGWSAGPTPLLSLPLLARVARVIHVWQPFEGSRIIVRKGSQVPVGSIVMIK